MAVQRHAVVIAGVVDNVIMIDLATEAGQSWPVPENATLVQTDEASPGWTYAAGVFTAPPEEE